MRLNGWQRLWVVLVVLWTFLVLAVSYIYWPRHAVTPAGADAQGFIPDPPTVPSSSTIMTVRNQRAIFAAEALATWAIPAGGIYFLGWSVGWIRRGFDTDSANPR